jgi:PII-like signaling protein
VVDLLRRHGLAGATALLGVDGTMAGMRRRAAFFGRNAEVPVMIIAVGDGDRIRLVLPELTGMLRRPLATLERVRVCKRDGRRLAEPSQVPGRDDAGLAIWQKLMVFSGEHARHDGAPLHAALVRRLREAGAAGATSLRGFWGFHGDHAPHGDTFWSLGRRVPVVTIVVDTPTNMVSWFAIVDEVTGRSGLVTSELVPAMRAASPAGSHGGLALAATS